MNKKKLDEQVALLTKITEALLKEESKEKYSKQFKELSNTSTEFRLPTFQQMYDDVKKAKNAAQLGTTSRGYLGLMNKIEFSFNIGIIQTAPGCFIHSLVLDSPFGSLTVSFLTSKKLPL